MTPFRKIISKFTSGINDREAHKIHPPRFAIRFFWSHPFVYQWYARLRHNIDIFDSSYDLVFDGFPRSGNTFGSRMIAITQDDSLNVLSTSHCPPFLIAALQINTPVCLTLRRPEDSIISWVILKRKLTLETVLKLYIDFYRVMLPYRSQLLVLPFTTITKDFSTALQLINQRFGMDLVIPDDLTACEREAFARIDRHYENESAGFDPLKVARPHPERDKLKAILREELKATRYTKLLKECHRLHHIFESEYRREVAKLLPQLRPLEKADSILSQTLPE